MIISGRLTFFVQYDESATIRAANRSIGSHAIVPNIDRESITGIPLKLAIEVLDAQAICGLTITQLLNRTIAVSQRKVDSGRNSVAQGAIQHAIRLKLTGVTHNGLY